MTSRKIQYWVIPPEADAEFVAAMEGVLDTYEKPYDADHPVLCMDEQPVQLTTETRRPIPATRRHAKRVDYEYERAGTASIFLFTEPLSGWREATARDTRTKRDWAVEMARLLEGRYRQCSAVTTGTCAGPGPTPSLPSHAETRQLAEHRRERAEFAHQAVRRGPAIRQAARLTVGTGYKVDGCQRHPTWRRLADESPRRPRQTQVSLSENQAATER